MTLSFSDVHALNILVLGQPADAQVEAQSYLSYCQTETARAMERYDVGEIDLEELTEAQTALAAAEALAENAGQMDDQPGYYCNCAEPSPEIGRRGVYSFDQDLSEDGEDVDTTYAVIECGRCGREIEPVNHMPVIAGQKGKRND